MKRYLEAAASIILGVILLYVALSHFGLAETMASVRKARPLLLLLGSSLMVSSYFLRAARWLIWERSLDYWSSIRLVLIGFMGNNVLPARLGEVLRAHCTSAKTSEDRGRTSALASIAAERILDGLILAIFGLAGVILVPVDRRLQRGLLFVSIIFVALALGLILSIHWHENVRSMIARTSKQFPGHLPAFAREKATQFIDGFLPLRMPGRLVKAIFVTALVWAIEATSYYCFGLAVWAGMTVKIALVFVVAVNFASLVPLTMGGIGSIEATAPLFLVSCGIPAYPVALAMVLVQHGAQYIFTTVTGLMAYSTGGFSSLLSLARPKRAPERHPPVLPQAVVEDTRSILDELSSSLELKPRTPREIDLSIIIPAYNEQARLPRTVLETIGWCTKRGLSFELIISDDGSRDQTLALGRLFEESDVRIRTLSCPHTGKGGAVRFGMLNASGRHVLFMDADGATPLDEIPKLLDALARGHDLAIGSRIVQNPGEVEIKASLHRRLIGRCFAFFVNLFAFGGIGDTQCGFKMFRREAALAIFPLQKTAGFAFDVEVLFIARRLSLSIAEVPVNWVAQPGSKVNLVTDSMKMLWDICRIQWLHSRFDENALLALRRQLSS
ncbi:MAG TPA: flippase-like domain-containing protein [Candidatus Acidoferrum sp.]|nr:flippase-like domain-containing protein [Candidatus Acidoferrum sp.]